MIKDKLIEIRKMKNISQKELAEKINVSPGNIGDWERGRANPGAEAIIKLCNFYEISADELLGLTVNTSKGDLSKYEIELLECYRTLPDIEKGILIGEARSMAKKYGKKDNEYDKIGNL